MKKINKKILNMTMILLIVMILSVMGVYAERIIASSIVTYDNKTSKLTSTNVQGAIDELYAKCVTGNATFNFIKYLQALEPSSTVISDDGTTDHNMRYKGSEPKNYVEFEGKLWRVIGVFNNVVNGSETKETRVKIVKAKSIGNKVWDSERISVWYGPSHTASLNIELQAMSYASSNLVEDAVWYLGDVAGGPFTASLNYTYERGTKVYSGNATTWTGKVALIYPSDFMFASGEYKEENGKQIEYSTSNWLYVTAFWFLTPAIGNTGAARTLRAGGYITNGDRANETFPTYPTVYLKTNVLCTNCSSGSVGTESNPFKITLG